MLILLVLVNTEAVQFHEDSIWSAQGATELSKLVVKAYQSMTDFLLIQDEMILQNGPIEPIQVYSHRKEST